MSKKTNLGAVTAYGIAVKNGYEGTEDEWLASLKGEQGPQGDVGPQGAKGDTGADGYTPIKGVDYFTDAEKQEIFDEAKESLGDVGPYEELSGTSDNKVKIFSLTPGTYKILKNSYVSILDGSGSYTVNDDIIINIGRHYANVEGYEHYNITGYIEIDTSYRTISYSAGKGTMEMMHYYTIGDDIIDYVQEGMYQESTGGLQTSNIVAGENIEVSIEGSNVVISGAGQTTYDLVIKTQEEFDAFCDTLENGTCKACSVLLVGDGGMTPFVRENGKGLKLPYNLNTLHGVNSPIIIINNFDKILSPAGIYRDGSMPLIESTKDIVLCLMTSGDTVHFMNMTNVRNCTIMTGAMNELLAEGTYHIGFFGCKNINNCSVMLMSNGGSVASFKDCEIISDCITVNADMNGGTAISYSNCTRIVNAKDMTTDNEFPEPIMYDEGCSYVGVVKEDLEGLGGGASPYEELTATSGNPIQLEQLTPGTYKILQGSYVNVGGNFCYVVDDVLMNIGRAYTTVTGSNALDITGFFAIDIYSGEPTIKYDVGPMPWSPTMHYYTINGTVTNGFYEGINQAGLTSMNILAGDGIQINYDTPGFIEIQATGGSSGGSSYIEGFNQDLYIADPDSTTDIADRGTKLFHYGCGLSNNAGELLTTLQSCSDARLKLEVYCNNMGVTYYYYLKDFHIASNGIAYFKGISDVNLNNSGCQEALIYVQVKAGQIIIDFEAFSDVGQKMKRAILEYC